MNRRGKPCPVCSSGLLPMVSAMLEAGARLTEIAACVPFNKHQLQRHKRHATCPPIADVTGSEMEMSDARLARWMARTEESYLAGGLQGDLRSQIDALRSGVRAELEFRRRQEICNDRNSESVPQNKITIEFLDSIIRETIDAGSFTCCTCGGPYKKAGANK